MVTVPLAPSAIVPRSVSALCVSTLAVIAVLIIFQNAVVREVNPNVIMALLAAPVAVSVIIIVARARVIVGFDIVIVATLV